MVVGKIPPLVDTELLELACPVVGCVSEVRGGFVGAQGDGGVIR